MELNVDKAQEKRLELLALVRDALMSCGVPEDHATRGASMVLDVSVKISAPEKERLTLHLITIGSGGVGGGNSTKPGNVALNIGSLLEALAAGTLTIEGVKDAPIFLPLALLVVWCALRKAAQVEISEIEATVLYVMWMLRNKDRDAAEDGLLDQCNRHLVKYERAALTSLEVRRALSKLEQIGAIERSPRGKSLWWLREWVSSKYR